MRLPSHSEHAGGDRVRQLVAGDGEQLLAHQLGDPLLLGHVAHDVVGEELRTLRRAGRRGGRRGRRARRRCGPRPGSRPRPPARTAAVSWAITCSRLARSTLLTTTTVLGRSRWPATQRSPEPNGAVASRTRHTTSTPASDSPTLSIAVELTLRPSAVTGLCRPGRVDEHELGVGPVEDAAHPVAGRLRLVRDDRHLGPADRVDERRLADVRPPDQRHEPRLHVTSHPSVSLHRRVCGSSPRIRHSDAVKHSDGPRPCRRGRPSTGPAARA